MRAFYEWVKFCMTDFDSISNSIIICRASVDAFVLDLWFSFSTFFFLLLLTVLMKQKYNYHTVFKVGESYCCFVHVAVFVLTVLQMPQLFLNCWSTNSPCIAQFRLLTPTFFSLALCWEACCQSLKHLRQRMLAQGKDIFNSCHYVPLIYFLNTSCYISRTTMWPYFPLFISLPVLITSMLSLCTILTTDVTLV